jgi:hypothetical protein
MTLRNLATIALALLAASALAAGLWLAVALPNLMLSGGPR